MNAYLSASNISYERYFSSVFGSVSLELQAGDTLLLTGPNGAGKTTLLKVLAGILRPATGSLNSSAVTFNGHQSGLQPDLTVLENLQFYQRLFGLPVDTSAVSRALQQLDAKSLAFKPAGKLSAGQHKRAALARLLLSHQPVWLLDEPFVNLDADTITIVLSLLKQHTQSGGICVIASHVLGLEALTSYPQLTLPATSMVDAT